MKISKIEIDVEPEMVRQVLMARMVREDYGAASISQYHAQLEEHTNPESIEAALEAAGAAMFNEFVFKAAEWKVNEVAVETMMNNYKK